MAAPLPSQPRCPKAHFTNATGSLCSSARAASIPAVTYGALLAALNTAWALLQQSVRVQADRLWLEPDFTGQQKADRCISLQVRSCAAVLLWLALRFARRLYKEPLWQPEKSKPLT